MQKLVWTSCYARERKIPRDVPRLIISNGEPRWWSGFGAPRVPEFTPSWELVERSKRDRAFDWRAAFRAELMKRDLLAVWGILPATSCVLLCHEKDWNDCHRKIVWDTLKAMLGEQVGGGEWRDPREPDQLSLLLL